MKDSLGDRIKNNYENRYRFFLTRRTPVIMRLDGKAFHTVTKHCKKPFDDKLWQCMYGTAIELLREIQGSKCAYMQSDEISILITDFDRLETQAWFDYNVQKMCSVAASIASFEFSSWFNTKGLFDCRVFNIPRNEVNNYFVWRQNDWIRNSIQMLGQAHFSHKELQNKSQQDILLMLEEKEIDWDSLEFRWRYGTFLTKEDSQVAEYHGHIFKNKPYMVEKWLQ